MARSRAPLSSTAGTPGGGSRPAAGLDRAIAASCFVLSGAAGLMYEVCWIRKSSLAFGSTLHATSTVLAVFFLGLALGSWTFGRVATRARRPLRLYGFLEALLGVLAALTLPAFGLAEEWYGRAFRALGDAPSLRLLVRFSLVAGVLLPPAFLMGGTLPLFCRQFVDRAGRIGAEVGRLYALNTAGAAAGCALAGFVLIPALGVVGTVVSGAALSVAAGLVAAVWRWPDPAPAGDAAAAPGNPRARGAVAVAVFAVLFLGGFAALGLEVLWTRFLALVIRQTVTTYTLALSVVLAGIVLGSLLAGRLADRFGARATVLGALQAGAGLVTLALMLQSPDFWRGFGSELGVAFALLLPPAVLSGAAFPFAVRMIAEDPAAAPRIAGRLTAVNTVGGIAGSLAAGFVLVPALGTQGALLALTAAGVVAAAVAWLAVDGTRPPPGRIVLAALAGLVWLLVPRVLGTRLPADFLASPSELVAWREGLQSNLAVVRRGGHRVLEIDRWWQGQDSRTHQVVAAHLPMLLHPDPRRVLVVGAGAGQTPGRVLLHDPERLDVVDIEPAVYDLIRSAFGSSWMDDPRVRLIRDDGRDLVTHGTGTYDVVSLEVGQIFRPGVGSFYTREFYGRLRKRLSPRGVVSQFVPLPFLTPSTFQRVLATFRASFPACALWYNTSELLLLGAVDSLDVTRIRFERWAGDPRLRSDLAFAYWGGPDFALDRPGVLAGGFLCGARGVAAIAAGAAPLSDDRPVLEYETRGADETQGRELGIVGLIRAHLDPLPAPGDEAARAARVRDLNLGDLAAGAHLRRAVAARGRADDAGVIDASAAALAENPENLEARRLLGDAYFRTGRVAEAESEFRGVVERDPADHEARRALAIAIHRQGRPAAAIPHYREALRLAPDDAEACNNLGAALAEGGDLAAARRLFERALELRPVYPDARRNLERVAAALRGGTDGPAPGERQGRTTERRPAEK